MRDYGIETIAPLVYKAVSLPWTYALVAWMIAFQFDGRQDCFSLDPAAYAPVLGERGLAIYRSRLDEIAAELTGGRYVCIEGAGHLPHARQPVLVWPLAHWPLELIWPLETGA